MTGHVGDDVAAFALGSLDELTAKRVLEHADQCPTCAVLLAEAMSTVSALEPSVVRPLSAPVELPSAQRPGERSGRSTSVFNWWLRAGAFAAAAAILAMGIWNVNLRSRIPMVPIASLVHSHFQHHALNGLAGAAKVIEALDGRWLYVVGDGLSPNTRYELRETIDGNQRTVGDFTTDASGQATAYWEQAPARIQNLSISRAGAKDAASELRWP